MSGLNFISQDLHPLHYCQLAWHTYAPLPTLRVFPHENTRTARGRMGLVALSYYGTFTRYILPVSLAHSAVGTRITPGPPHRSGRAR